MTNKVTYRGEDLFELCSNKLVSFEMPSQVQMIIYDQAQRVPQGVKVQCKVMYVCESVWYTV